MHESSISVIIPMFNAERYIAATIQSVFDQRISPAEIIIVDDGSTDGSAAIVQTFAPRVHYLHQPNLGPAAARNLGVRQTTGDLLAFLDADDLWTADKLQRQCAALSDHPELDAVLGQIENFISPDSARSKQGHWPDLPPVQAGYHAGALLIRRAAFQRVGGFDETLQSGEFIDWWVRAVEGGLAYRVLPEVVMHRRWHDHNHTLRRPDTLNDYTRIARSALARRRAAP